MVHYKEATSRGISTIPEMKVHKQIRHTKISIVLNDGIMVNFFHKWIQSKCLVKLMMRVSWNKPCIQLGQWHRGVPMWCMEITMPILLAAKVSTTLWYAEKTPRGIHLTYTMLELVISVHASQQRWIVNCYSVRKGFSLNLDKQEQSFASMNA